MSANASGFVATTRSRTVIVTGCTRGIGRGLFEWFASQGYNVAGCGTQRAELDVVETAARAAIPSHNKTDVRVKVVDLREEAAVQNWFEEVAKSFGAIDILVCCAGALPALGDFCEIPAEEWRLACEVNVLGTARTLRHAVPLLRSPGATVVLLSSRYGRSVVCKQAAYCATKWATEAMGKALALELQDKGVTVVPLDPGLVHTQMLLRSSSGNDAWCAEQRSPANFAAEVGPFIAALELADTGRSLTAPGSPAAYFKTGEPHSGRPAWANGIGPFFRACDDLQPPSKRQKVATAVSGIRRRRYFISGVMLGSKTQLNCVQKDLAPQDYRAQIANAILKADPQAEIVEPMKYVQAFAEARNITIEELNKDDAMVRLSFEEVINLVPMCDAIVSNLPQASMGSAVELWEAKRAGLLILTISPMADNWTIRAVTKHNFTDLEDFEKNFAAFVPN